jgi:amino acid adenylation domain-containing protein
MADHEFTYDDLNHRANRLARAILAKRANGSVPVLLLLDSSPHAIMAILAVLKAGKFYVPVDMTFPIERIAFMARDCAADLIVTDSQNLVRAKSLATSGIEVIDLDAVDGEDDADLGLHLSPETRASIIYTSGSTGQPNGVVQNHIGILHRAMVYANLLHICPQDRLTLLHTYSAGSALHHLFSAILIGASVHCFNTKLGTGRALADWLINEAITVYHSIPAVFRQMTTALKQAEVFPHLRAVSLSAAAMSLAEFEHYRDHCSTACVLVHLLGGTETGFISTHFMDHSVEVPPTPIPVGYAVADKAITIVDETGQHLVSPVRGEIAVTSRYLAEGYWQRPKLTNAKFSPNAAGGGDRRYLTGDLGYQSDDGCLTHVGRQDSRVKINGYRVEIGEIERTLLDHPGVQDAAVITRQRRGQDRQLVAYYVAAQRPSALVRELRAHLQACLPAYMVPSRFIELDSLPLTPNGKLDRHALPEPGNQRPRLDTPLAPPGTDVERELTRLWAEVLDLDEVGIHDSLLDLGGHSLSAVQILSRVIQTFQIDIPIRTLFQAPTVAQMAALIDGQRDKKTDAENLDQLIAKLESMSEADAAARVAAVLPDNDNHG